MLLYQDKKTQKKCKTRLLWDIYYLQQMWKGPFFCGEQITMGDIAIAPWMDRLDVLKEYRDFEVPFDPKGHGDNNYENFWKWKKNVLEHPAIKGTRQPRDKLIACYKGYANGTIRSGNY
jgi:glutathione S-transferase